MKNLSLQILILSNLVPLVGLLFWQWDVASIVVFYWVENLVVGFYNVLKILKAEKAVEESDQIKVNGRPFVGQPGNSVALFFIFHFGIFTFVHGVFVFSMFGLSGVNFLALIYGFVTLMISHGISYQNNYLGKKEYKKLSKFEVMSLPYKRIIVLHFVILFGGIAVQFFSLDAAAVILLVVIKTVIDIGTHKKEHMFVRNKVLVPDGHSKEVQEHFRPPSINT